jgi:membrane-associated phospholipid phosphatase
VPLKYDDSPLVNPYAALPSLHVGWALLIGLGVVLATKKLWLRVIAVMIAPAMLAATVITGNHYIVDGIFGGILCSVTFLMALWLHGHWPEIEPGLKARFQNLRGRPVPAA